MSASGMREALATAEGVQRYSRVLYSVNVSLDEAEGMCMIFAERIEDRLSAGWMCCRSATSVGPAVALKNALKDGGYLDRDTTDASEDEDEMLPIQGEGRKRLACISPVARSKMFRTNWKVLLPIDLTTLYVAGIER